MAADDLKPDRNSYKPGDEGTALWQKDLDAWYGRHPDQKPKANQNTAGAGGSDAAAVGGAHAPVAPAPIGDVSGRINLHSAGAGAPDPNDPKYQGLPGAALFSKDTKAWQALQAKRDALRKMP
jgi:hypothetical protein